MSASTTVLSSSSTRFPAACRLRTASEKVVQCLLDVSGRPGGQPEEPGRGSAHEVVIGSGQVQRAPGVPDGAGDVATRLGQRRTVDRDRRRRGAQVLGVRPASPRAPGRGRRQPAPPRRRRAGLDRVEVTGQHQRPAGQDAEDRAAAHHRLGQRPHPAQQQAVLPGAAQLRKRLLDQERGAVEVLGGERVPDGVRDEVVRGVPGAGPLVQRRHLLGMLGEQAGAQDVGEQVVVAVPGASVSSGTQEEVAALQVRQHPRCRRRRPVTASHSGPVSRSRTAVRSRKSRTSRRLPGQHLVGQVVDARTGCCR